MLAFNDEAIVVVMTTFLAAAAAMVSLTACAYITTRQSPGPLYAVNGILMGLIIITPLAGSVSPGSALILGLLGGPLFIAGEWVLPRLRWLSDPVGLLPGHLVGGLFGVLMIAFFTQTPFAAGSGFPKLPNGLLFGGGGSAVKQLGLEVLGIGAVMAAVFRPLVPDRSGDQRRVRRHHQHAGERRTRDRRTCLPGSRLGQVTLDTSLL